MKTFPKTLTRVTLFSKFLALFLFFIFILAAFIVGTKYQKTLDSTTLVGITPTPTPSAEGMPCGGFVYHPKECPPGYICRLGKIQDMGGVCIKSLQ